LCFDGCEVTHGSEPVVEFCYLKCLASRVRKDYFLLRPFSNCFK